MKIDAVWDVWMNGLFDGWMDRSPEMLFGLPYGWVSLNVLLLDTVDVHNCHLRDVV